MPRMKFTLTMHPLKRLRVNIFDYKSVRQFAKDYPAELLQAKKNEVQETILNAVSVVRDRLADEIRSDHHGTGNLADALKYHYNTQYMSAYLHFDTAIAPYAQYVEYGTGVVGEASGSNSPLPSGWVYDLNDHGEDGWMYVDDAGKLKHTKGQVGMGYMWIAQQMLEGRLPQGLNYSVNRGRKGAGEE